MTNKTETRKQVIAKAVFDWFNLEGKAPYSYNQMSEELEIGVDGEFRCADLADFIDAALAKAGL